MCQLRKQSTSLIDLDCGCIHFTNPLSHASLLCPICCLHGPLATLLFQFLLALHTLRQVPPVIATPLLCTSPLPFDIVVASWWLRCCTALVREASPSVEKLLFGSGGSGLHACRICKLACIVHWVEGHCKVPMGGCARDIGLDWLWPWVTFAFLFS